MGEASALGRTNNISGGRISEEAEGVAMVFAPPAGAKKGLPRLPVMGWRERSVQVRCELHATLGSSRTQRADPKNQERTDIKINQLMDFYRSEESSSGSDGNLVAPAGVGTVKTRLKHRKVDARRQIGRITSENQA